MGSHSGPEIVNDGLVFTYDMGNGKKSWKGAPTANLYTDGDFSAQALHPVRSGTWTIVADPRNNAKKVLKATPSGSNQYHGRDITVTVSSVYSLQMEVYVSPDFNGTNVQMYPEQGGSGANIAYNLSNKGTWQLLKFNGKSATTTNIRMLAYVLSAFTTGYVLISNVQVELNSLATPFINGTRSNTQAILDWTGNNTITANSLTYNVDGSFSFDGAANYITIPNTTLGNGNIPWTVSAWMKTTTTTNVLGQGAILSNAASGPVYSVMGVNNGKIVYWTYQSSAWSQKLGVGKTVNDGNWHMLTWVNYNNFTMDMYVDGILDSNVLNSTSGNNNPVDRIGGSWNSLFPGSISVLSRYNRALTATEVQQNFNALRGRYGL